MPAELSFWLLLHVQPPKPETGRKSLVCQKVMVLMKIFWLTKKLKQFIFHFPIISILNGRSKPSGLENMCCVKNLWL